METSPDTVFAALSNGLDFLSAITRARLAQLVRPDTALQMPEFHFHHDGSPLATFVVEQQLTIEEYLLVFIALAPHLHPNFFGSLIAEHFPGGSDMPEFGGVRNGSTRAILPTGETALFILAGLDLPERLRVSRLLHAEHRLFQQKILHLEAPADADPLYSGRLTLTRDWLERFLFGSAALPRLSLRFPAQHIDTELVWEDLVLNEHARAQLQEIKIWVDHHETLIREWQMAARIRPGYRALFYGPSGTGKTLAATLLGKYTQREVFKIDLATLVSKYIGETEKNLANLFELAEYKDWILFFDEADAIFGKRTQVRDAHDKYANQEVSYLLQRIETYPGIVILASNFRANLDDAFVRRFQSIVYFPFPKPAERLQLWQRNLPAIANLEDGLDLAQVAEKYELSGANIVNIIQRCCLQAIAEGTRSISKESLLGGINRELLKENKVI